jgi:hypothetical protein
MQQPDDFGVVGPKGPLITSLNEENGSSPHERSVEGD